MWTTTLNQLLFPVQFDVYGNLFGLLAAHPVAPLVSMHHQDLVEPIFPNGGRIQALARLTVPAKLDSAGLMQQSICYDPARNWTLSVSWGYAVQIIRGAIMAREMERPARTFVDWYKRDDPVGFSFNTRPFSKHPCQKPYIYYLSNAVLNPTTNATKSEYIVHKMPHPWCWWKVDNPERIERVEVYKKSNPHKWDLHQVIKYILYYLNLSLIIIDCQIFYVVFLLRKNKNHFIHSNSPLY